MLQLGQEGACGRCHFVAVIASWEQVTIYVHCHHDRAVTQSLLNDLRGNSSPPSCRRLMQRREKEADLDEYRLMASNMLYACGEVAAYCRDCREVAENHLREISFAMRE